MLGLGKGKRMGKGHSAVGSEATLRPIVYTKRPVLRNAEIQGHFKRANSDLEIETVALQLMSVDRPHEESHGKHCNGSSLIWRPGDIN